MSNQSNEGLINFLKIFNESVVQSLTKTLDTDICNKIAFDFESVFSNKDIESLKEGNIIYKIDYATGNRQGSLAILIPEELIANVADILTGGKGEGAYRGSISEIETNSLSNTFKQTFKNIESNFKQKFESDLIFSSNPLILLKEMDDFEINSSDQSYDYVINNKLKLNDKQEFDIKLLLNEYVLDNLMADLGLSKSSAVPIKTGPTSIDLSCLSDVKINITAELGRTRVPIKYALELVQGSLVELDTQNNADIKVFANGVEFAYAQVVAIEDSFGLKITKIISPEERMNLV